MKLPGITVVVGFLILTTRMNSPVAHGETASPVDTSAARRVYADPSQFENANAVLNSTATSDCACEASSRIEGFGCPSCRLCPCCYAWVDGLILQRVNQSSTQPIIVEQDINGNVTNTLLSTSNLDFDVGGGFRVTVGKRLDSGCALELSYLGLFNADASATVVTPGSGSVLTFPGPLGPASNVFFDVDRVRANYDTALHSAEINLVSCCCCCEPGCCPCAPPSCQSVEWLIGFRYIYLPETLQIFGERSELGGLETGVYDLRTDNNLFGAQVGGRFRRCVGRWGWDATAKAGIYGNDAQQRQSLTDFPDFYLRPPTGDEHGQVAFLGELGFNLIYQLSNAWYLRGGYNLFWIDGVALAPDQLDFSAAVDAGRSLDSTGSVFLHGVNVGLEARW